MAELELVAERVLPRIDIAAQPGEPGTVGELEAFFDDSSAPMTTPVIPRANLSIDDTLTGPVVVYEEGATTVIPPRAIARVVEGGALLVDLRDV